MKPLTILFLFISLTITVNAQAQDQQVLREFEEGLQLNYLALSDGSSGDDAEKDISFKKQAQDQEELWDFGVGFRVNYLRLTGSISGYSAKDNTNIDINYKTVGMANYSPSFLIVLAGKYKKWNLFFGASRGSYTGSFVTKGDITIKDKTIPSGSEVDGKIEMGIYSLSTTYALVRKKHDLGMGFGILLLDSGMELKTQDRTLEDSQIFPMPFLALSGRLNFGKFKITAVGGGAYFDGEMDDSDYTVWYYTADIKAGYEIYRTNNYTTELSLGYRSLHMNSNSSKDGSWLEKNDRYQGPFFGVIVKYTKNVSKID